MSAIDDKISALETKLKQAKAAKQQAEARKRAQETKRKRSEDTRRKILVGGMILSKLDREEWDKNKLTAMLDTYLTRNHDRALFDLPPLPQSDTEQAVAAIDVNTAQRNAELAALVSSAQEFESSLNRN